MQKAPKVQDKYYLKAVHQEIALFDRKLAHLDNFEVFATEEDRKLAAKKMNNKRNLLVQTARRLMSEGIEFKASDLPRSFSTETADPALINSESTPVSVSSPEMWV